MRGDVGTFSPPGAASFLMAWLSMRGARRLLPDIPAVLPGAGRLDLKPPSAADETSTVPRPNQTSLQVG